ncbi:MAG: monooxygenase [Actinomycetota bacterium]|nr:monooxygenase [Actinomycetota bacterium]
MEDSPDVPALVTLHLWTVAPRRVPAAVARMALDRGAIRRTPGVRFAKLLGTGDGRTFTARDADPLLWGLLVSWASSSDADRFESSAVARSWGRIASDRWRADLRPVRSRGTWSGRRPFGDPAAARQDGPVAAVTRARLRAATALSFWRAVPPVSADLHAGGGLRYAVGIGEAPVGLQGTFSVWSDAASLNAFAYARSPHQVAITRTAEERWYAEELFARFALLDATGSVKGADPMAG